MAKSLLPTATDGIAFQSSDGSIGYIPLVLYGTVARTDTAAKTLGTLPPNAIVVEVVVWSAAASNAGTTATLSLGKSGGTGTEFLNALDVKGATGSGQQTPTTATLGTAGSTQTTVTGIYAETGTASSAGGPWNVTVRYIVQ